MGVLEHDLISVAINDTVGTTELVAAVAGKKIVVTTVVLFADAADDTTAQLKSATTALTGPIKFQWANALPNPGVNVSNSEGVLATASGEALNLTVTGGGSIIGWVTYHTVTG